MGDVNVKYGTRTAITISPASTATSSTFIAGRESSEVDNSSALNVDVLVQGKIRVGTTPTANTQIRVYVWDSDQSLATAAQWSLANLALENRQVDTAIARLEDLLRGGVTGDRARPVRWQLAAARATKGEWPAARAEIEELLSDPRTRADWLERLQAFI